MSALKNHTDSAAEGGLEFFYLFYVGNAGLIYFYKQNNLIDEVKAQNMLIELQKLHNSSIIKRQLSTRLARPKFEEITKELDYKFKIIENYVRSVEYESLNIFSMPILGNYQFILDAKKELVMLQKRIINFIKAKEKEQ